MFQRLHDFIGSAYALILGRFVIVELNGNRVSAQPIPLGMSSKVTPASETFEVGNVTITMLTGLAERAEGEWPVERAGWYVFCNGRVVVFADKTELTGWGISSAQFVSKYRGFVGLVFFFSEDPESLPWTTTKRGLNRESKPYLVARNKMAVLARPVLTFLNSMYASGEAEEPVERDIAVAMKSSPLAAVIRAAKPVFRVDMAKSEPRQYVSVQFKAKRADIERAKKHLKKMHWSASDLGRHAFEYFLKNECGGDA